MEHSDNRGVYPPSQADIDESNREKPDNHRSRFWPRVLQGVAAVLGLTAAGCAVAPTKVVEVTEAPSTPESTPTIIPYTPTATEAPPTATATKVPPTETPKPVSIPERVVRSPGSFSAKYELAPTTIQVNKTIEELRLEKGIQNDQFAAIAPIAPFDSQGNPTTMTLEVAHTGLMEEDYVTGFFYEALSQDTAVRAIESGIIEDVFPGYDGQTNQIVDWTVQIRHEGSGISTQYRQIHGQEKPLVQKNDRVRQGQVITKIGDPKLPYMVPADLQVNIIPPKQFFEPVRDLNKLKEFWSGSFKRFFLSWPPFSVVEGK